MLLCLALRQSLLDTEAVKLSPIRVLLDLICSSRASNRQEIALDLLSVHHLAIIEHTIGSGTCLHRAVSLFLGCRRWACPDCAPDLREDDPGAVCSSVELSVAALVEVLLLAHT